MQGSTDTAQVRRMRLLLSEDRRSLAARLGLALLSARSDVGGFHWRRSQPVRVEYREPLKRSLHEQVQALETVWPNGCLVERLWRTRDLHQALDEILGGAIELLGADMGIIRILNTTREVLTVKAHRGLPPEFLASFGELPAPSTSACGKALLSGK